ncbi:hypothetical protein M422DRAFT_777027 [Sphaerobolus stellatus SS14]|nr:hypothetical protein M422DRAFT_777027 [Sphaerobolus stellatus SS14]
MNSGSNHWQPLSPIHSLGPVIETHRASTLSTIRCEAHPDSKVIIDGNEGQRLFPCQLTSDARTRIDPVGSCPLQAFPNSNISWTDTTALSPTGGFHFDTSPSYLGTDSIPHSHSQPIDNDGLQPDLFSFAMETSNPMMEVKGKHPFTPLGEPSSSASATPIISNRYDSSTEEVMPLFIDTANNHMPSFDSQAQTWSSMGNSFALPSFPTEYEADQSVINLGRSLQATLDESDSTTSQGSRGAHSVASEPFPSIAISSPESQNIEALLPQTSTSAVVPQLHSPGHSPSMGAKRHHAILPLKPLDNQSIQKHIYKFVSEEGPIFKCRMKRCRSPAFHDELKAQEHVQGHFANKRVRCLCPRRKWSTKQEPKIGGISFEQFPFWAFATYASPLRDRDAHASRRRLSLRWAAFRPPQAPAWPRGTLKGFYDLLSVIPTPSTSCMLRIPTRLRSSSVVGVLTGWVNSEIHDGPIQSRRSLARKQHKHGAVAQVVTAMRDDPASRFRVLSLRVINATLSSTGATMNHSTDEDVEGLPGAGPSALRWGGLSTHAEEAQDDGVPPRTNPSRSSTSPSPSMSSPIPNGRPSSRTPSSSKFNSTPTTPRPTTISTRPLPNPPKKPITPSLTTLEKAVATRLYFENIYFPLHLRHPPSRDQHLQALERDLASLIVPEPIRQR